MLYTGMAWLTPLWASWGVMGSVGVIVWGTVKIVLCGSSLSFLMNTGLPTLAATAFWRFGAGWPRLFFLFFPVMAFFLFTAIVGIGPDLFFASYWLFMPLLYFFPSVRSTLLMHAIAASLTAHMAGAFIVLFFGKPVAWAAIAPFVLSERLITAFGMTGVALLNRSSIGLRKQVSW